MVRSACLKTIQKGTCGMFDGSLIVQCCSAISQKALRRVCQAPHKTTRLDTQACITTQTAIKTPEIRPAVTASQHNTDTHTKSVVKHKIHTLSFTHMQTNTHSNSVPTIHPHCCYHVPGHTHVNHINTWSNTHTFIHPCRCLCV